MSEEELREYRRKKSKEWREANYDRYRENIRRWQKNNIHKGRLYRSQCRAKTKDIVDIRLVHNWESRICGICHKSIEDDYHIDHIVPLSRGGGHRTDNLQLAHPYCNQSKFTKLTEELQVIE